MAEDSTGGARSTHGVDVTAGSVPATIATTPEVEYVVIARGTCQVATTAPEALPDGGFLWIDVHVGSGRGWAETVRRLTGIEIFEEHLKDSENPAHPSFFDSTLHYEMIVMRALAPRRAPMPETSSLGRIRIQTQPAVFFLLPRCLVTVRPAGGYLDPSIRERLLTAGRSSQRAPGRPEELALRLLSGMVDRYLELRQPLTLQLETWQRHLLNPNRPFKDWSTLLEARMELRKLQHLSEEQLDAIQEWRDERMEHEPDDSQTTLPPFSDTLNVRATDVVEHIQRVRNHAASLESAVESAVQLHFSATAYRTSEIMRVLTVLTAIFMPLTLITGIFGMNFDGLPGIHSPTGFWITLGVMGLIGLGMLAWFLTRRYIEAPPMADGRPRRRRQAAPDLDPQTIVGPQTAPPP